MMESTKTQIVKAQVEGDTLELFYAFPTIKHTQPLATIIVLPAWHGRDSFMCEKAKYFASQGFLSIAVDLFGEAKIGKTREECHRLIQPFTENRQALKDRLSQLITFLQHDSRIDSNHINAIGYCFGGMCALDMARNNLGLKAAISIHGLLFKPDYDLPTHYSAKIMALHGHKDPMVAPEQVADFQKEMEKSANDWQMIIYGQGLHSFTLPAANDPIIGTIYNPLLDQRTTKLVNNFLEEIAP